MIYLAMIFMLVQFSPGSDEYGNVYGENRPSPFSNEVYPRPEPYQPPPIQYEPPQGPRSDPD